MRLLGTCEVLRDRYIVRTSAMPDESVASIVISSQQRAVTPAAFVREEKMTQKLDGQGG